MIRKIVKLGDETLRKQSKPMQKFDLRLWLLLVGILRRVVVVDTGDGLVELINPEIIAREGEQAGAEGCLSLPGRQGYVVRPQKVTVRAQDRKGKPFEITAEGLKARAFCHEIDHLDGVLYIDVMDHEIFDEDKESK